MANGSKRSQQEPPTTKVTTLRNACYENLPEPGFENCATQRELFCGDQDVAWVQASTMDTARPEDAPVKGSAFCADGSAAAPPAPPQPSRPAVSIDDMGEVIAPEPRILADTDGRGVRNAETNFYSPEAVRHETAVIDGVSVEMRLSPVSFIWDYGDGTAPVTTDVGGNPQDGFDVRTPTSHVYDETGTYEVTLTTVYTGEIRYPGQGWEAVPGTIRRTAAPVTADIWTTSTRNVADDCSADASAWGCAGPVEAPNGG
ncbi:PKD domain-containing protein [Micrococcus porci]|uniref:PKD domain-containing protein n=1 Tax=Micrococcus porci TaxID=2856555 RepID=UPI003CE715F4